MKQKQSYPRYKESREKNRPKPTQVARIVVDHNGYTFKQKQVSRICGFIAVCTLILWFTGILVMMGVNQYTTHQITANYFITEIVAGAVILYILNLIHEVYGTGKI